ncbi:MAG: hypothetical protein DWI58_10010 [Chloroflexi bacterium]|nr:MAG: hypothetical protein DWI58_10010 [Chloroflexota bacterium]
MTPEELAALPEYVRALLRSEAYPHRPSEVTLIQTHLSYAFLAGDLVYKTKKPVDFGFIEQLGLKTRERFCHNEVRLNRRLAPDVYLDVAPVIQRRDGSIVIDVPASEGEVIEWAVKMRRLPEAATLDALVRDEHVPYDMADRLVARLVPFHDDAERAPGGLVFAGVGAVAAWWKREAGEAAGFIGSTWAPEDAATMHAMVDGTLASEAATFAQRVTDGRIVRGHGDLHTKHVYVLGPRVADIVCVDGIEFSEWFQIGWQDIGHDIAFLAMDLEAHGEVSLADEFIGRYLASTQDETLPLLQPLHRAFRAFVRGKVESIGAQAAEVPADQRAALAESAARYFRLASTYAGRRAAPCLVVLCGPSGTGKSTIGGALASRIGAAMISSDAVRKRVAGLEPHTRVSEAFRTGLYSPEMSERTYETMLRRAAEHLAASHAVVLDATHSRAEDRAAAIAVARAAGVPVLVISLTLSDDAALARIEQRQSGTLTTSDATPAIYRQQVERFEPPRQSEGPLLVIDAADDVSALVARIAEALPSRG